MENTNKKLVEQVFNEAMNKQNFSLLDKIIGPTYVNHMQPDKKGPEGLKEILQQFLGGFPDMQIKIEHIAADGDLIATRGYWTGTNKGSFMGMPSTGKKVKVEYVDFWRAQNGMLVENWVQMDLQSMMMQLGLAPANASI